ncbi:MAG: FAD-binding oxidoreductase [Cellvibrionaceae bacterium]|nr:FAD-binding oxidoreductase [Cellvibrionaceae bacterium]
MIPAIPATSAVQQHYLDFLHALEATGFEGDICADYANRTVLSTDNSIYQVLPQGVVYPKHTQDIRTLTKLSHQPQFRDIVISARGGGTGTNAQSLTDGIVVDTSKYMNRVLEINAEQSWVRVQCGVVKDQLNAAIHEYGLFFAPELSTSNRATIGGMINTDASGQGSCVYGKTRDHVLSLRTVLADGSVLDTHPMEASELAQAQQHQGRAGSIYRLVDTLQQQHQDTIANTFPPLNRCLTGYDLAHLRTRDNRLDLNSLLCGSEGTLGFIVEAKLNLLPIPKVSALVNLQYTDFDSALRDANAIMQEGPSSIETIDSRVLKLAQEDSIWHSVAEFFPTEKSTPLAGINLVEYTADTDAELEQKMQPLLQSLATNTQTRSINHTTARNSDVKKIWAMRKKAVGLLGNTQGEARPVAFVEDTAVPPEHLADFILEFRALLDSYQLEYGMFGHVDAGVLHVRPILDMKQAQDEALIRKISDQVVKLTHKYGGLLWGEHGKGVRSEYSPTFFGSLYPVLQQIKAAFDPYNQLNPGKIATPDNGIELLKIDEVPTRGQGDKTIDSASWQDYKDAVFCNGNGLCHNWNPNEAMCPSWKGTRKRTHTPKGRASLIRQWLQQLNRQHTSAVAEADKLMQQSLCTRLLNFPKKIKHSYQKHRGDYDFSHEVHDAMMACLACKSCTGTCPVKVDVPEFRSKFLHLYYGRYLRPVKDYIVGTLEFVIPVAAKMPGLYNLLMGASWVQTCLARYAGLSDSPLLSRVYFERELQQRQYHYATADNLAALSSAEKQQAVIVVQDAFTRFFETRLLLDTLDALKHLGFTPLLAPFHPNGKPLHVHGFRRAFAKTATATAKQLNALAASGISMVGIEPSMTLAYRSEYQKVLGDKAPPILLVQEWLAQQTLPAQKTQHKPSAQKNYKLLAHCTEKTNAPQSMKDWQTVFSKLGYSLEVVETGCCGMAGTYGHETAQIATSKRIYALSWQQAINNAQWPEQLLATGYSCRSQVQRIDGKTLAHPLQVLLKTKP